MRGNARAVSSYRAAKNMRNEMKRKSKKMNNNSVISDLEGNRNGVSIYIINMYYGIMAA